MRLMFPDMYPDGVENVAQGREAREVALEPASPLRKAADLIVVLAAIYSVGAIPLTIGFKDLLAKGAVWGDVFKPALGSMYGRFYFFYACTMRCRLESLEIQAFCCSKPPNVSFLL